MEVFDSVTLLSLLIIPGDQFSEIWSSFNKPIIVLSSLNLVFPTITLFSLTLSDFGRRMSKVTRLNVTNQALQLFLINIPFLYVRLHLWAKYDTELSMFVVKNLCYIFLLCHSLYPGMIRMFKECERRRHKVGNFSKKKLMPYDQSFEMKDDSEEYEIRSETLGNVPSGLDQVDAGRSKSLHQPPNRLNEKDEWDNRKTFHGCPEKLGSTDIQLTRSSMQDLNLIPMTELSYDGTKDNESKDKGAIRRRQDSSNMATSALVESIESHSTNPNHRVSTSSSSPTTVGSPSSPKALNVSDSPVSSNSPL